ncbi:MAG: hypothetical protein HZC40_19530 [Chloroflexi bacterium]|nr:hypothetical protein [Chloroflexota bacterium]
MTWNYRVFRDAKDAYVIREVYYEEDGSIFACTQDAVEPFGETVEELAQDLKYFKQALKLPVLTMADIPGASAAKQTKARGKKTSGNQPVAKPSKAKSNTAGKGKR